MSFSKDLQDFVSGFKGGWKMVDDTRKADAAVNASNRLSATERKMMEEADERGVFRSGAGALDTSDASVPMPKLPTFAQGNPDLDAAVRTVYGEAAGEPLEGKQAVAAVIRNRARQSGKSIPAVVLAKGQFEPWMTPDGRRRMMSLSPSSREYQEIARAISPVLAGEVDPTRGATHFYAPKAQRALGRKAPSWDDGTGFDLGNHRFFRRRYAEGEGALPLEEELPVVYAAAGGLIEDPYAGRSESAGSNPAVREAIEEGPDPRMFTDIDTISDMARDGMAYLEKAFKLDKMPAIPEAASKPHDGVQAYALNVGAAKPQEVEQIKNTVDPDRKLPSEELRAIAGWNAVYKYHTRKGNAVGAQRAAAAMLMYSKQAAQVAGTMALAAAEDGNKVAAAKAIQAGYEALPDGKSIKIAGETPKGVKFQLVDENGEITEQGEATMDQMVKIATGMQNGTEWFRAANLLRSRNTTAKQNKARSDARSEFEGLTTDDRDFVSTLDDKQREAYLKMDPRDRREYAQRHERRAQEDAKEGRFAERQANTAEREEYRRRTDAFKTALRQDNWEKMRETQMSQADRRIAAYERDLSDRNTRHQESAEERRKRYADIDRRILERGAAGIVGGRLTAAEAREERRKGALELGVDAIEQEKGNIAAEMSETYDPTEVRQKVQAVDQRANALRAQHSYDTSVKENRNNIDLDATYGEVNEFLDADASRKAVPVQHREAMAGIAAGIGRANNVPTKQAVRIAFEALNRDAPVKFVRDPRDPQGNTVQIGSNPPVRLGRDELNLIAMARGGVLNPTKGEETQRINYRGATGNNDSAGPAVPGASGNPRTVLPRQVTSDGLRKPLNQVQEAQPNKFVRQREHALRMRALDIEGR